MKNLKLIILFFSVSFLSNSNLFSDIYLEMPLNISPQTASPNKNLPLEEQQDLLRKVMRNDRRINVDSRFNNQIQMVEGFKLEVYSCIRNKTYEQIRQDFDSKRNLSQKSNEEIFCNFNYWINPHFYDYVKNMKNKLQI